MAGKKGKADRSYGRLTIADRREIKAGLDRGRSVRSIAADLGRSPSTVAREVERNRVVTRGAGKGGRVEAAGAPDNACPRLLEPPRVCNGCPQHRSGRCGRPWRCAYDARAAQDLADGTLSEARRGIDATPEEAERMLACVRGGLARGLSPAQIAAEAGVSESTIYRWVSLGYGGMTNLDLRRKVGYKKRVRSEPRETSHGPARSHGAFLALPEGARAGAWEMDTVVGRATDRAALLTLLHRPTRLQLVALLEDKDVAHVAACLDRAEEACGEAFGALFPCLLTDNGTEFCDHDLLERSASGGRRLRVYYCDPRQSQQKGACEKNHVEIRKILPKRRGISFDDLTEADVAVVSSQVNSSPRPGLGGLTPAFMFAAAFGEAGVALLDAFGVSMLGWAELDMTPGAVARARELRGEPPLPNLPA